MAARKNTTTPETTPEEKQETTTPEATPEEKQEEEKPEEETEKEPEEEATKAKTESAGGFEKGKTYAAKDVMPLRSASGAPIGKSIYKHNAITVKSVKTEKDGSIWLETENGFVCGRDAAGNVYFT